MHAYGVPWGQSFHTHAFHLLFNVGIRSGGLVSKVYNLLLNSSCGPLTVHQVWEREFEHLGGEINWFTVWDNLHRTSKNPNHKLIQLNFLHRLYLTPRKFHLMKLTLSILSSMYSRLCGLISTYVLGVPRSGFILECSNFCIIKSTGAAHSLLSQIADSERYVNT